MSTPRVLIVDDDQEMRRLLRVMLEVARFEVDEAVNGLRLLSLLRVRRPDVILLDVMMSWASGFDLCRSLKQNRYYADIPICLFSGYRVDETDINEGLRRGAAAYFRKPIDWRALIETLDRLVGRGRPATLDGAAL